MLLLTLAFAQEPPVEDEEALGAFEPLVEQSVAPTALEPRLEVGVQLGVSAPRSALKAGANPALVGTWSPVPAGGRLRLGVQLGLATSSGSGLAQGEAWEARQTGLELHGLLAVRALPREAPVSPELVLGLGAAQVWALTESAGGAVVDAQQGLSWMAGPALSAELPLGSLSLQVVAAGLSPTALGAPSGLALRPSIGWRWHR